MPSNPDPLFMLVFMIISMINGMVLYRIAGHAKYILSHYWNRTQFPKLIGADEGYGCGFKDSNPKGESHHHWVKTVLAMYGVEPGHYLVCDHCGIVAGKTHLRLNAAGIEVLKNNAKLQEERAEKERNFEKSVTRFSEILDADRIMWIKTYINQFGRDQAKNEELLAEFSKFTVESMEAAGTRVKEEFKGKI